MHLLKLQGASVSRRFAVRARLQPEILEARQLLSTVDVSGLMASPSINGTARPAAASAGAAAPYEPLQIRNAYGINQLSDDGSGQTIAIVDAYNAPNISSDLDTFDRQFAPSADSTNLYNQYGPASSFLTVVNQSGGNSYPADDSGWAVEIALDVEWAHAIAPGAKILLVEANSASYNDLLSAVQYASQNAQVVSMSWGGSEFSGENSFDASTFAAPGVVYVGSSGDDGVLEWPSSSPNVVAVGGTSLTADSAGTYSQETAWSGSGGGVSRYEPLPSYQLNAFGRYASGRTTPDVAYDADGSTGVYVYASGWYEVGGTSAGSPQWAAIFALADQARAAAGTPALDSSSVPKGLYDLAYSLYQGTPSTFFHDVTSGNNARYLAGSGYDLVTGLGSPIAQNLVPYLTTWTPQTPSPTPTPTHGHGHNHGQVATATAPATPSAPTVIVVSGSAHSPASGQVIALIPTAAPTTAATPSTSLAAASATGSTAVTAARPAQSLLRASPTDVRLVVPSNQASERPFTPAPDDPPAVPASGPSATPTAPSRGAPEAPAVTLSLLRAWDVAVTAMIGGDGESALPLTTASLPTEAETEAAEDLAHSALESTLMSGVAVALWGAWEVQSRREDRRRRRGPINVGR